SGGHEINPIYFSSTRKRPVDLLEIIRSWTLEGPHIIRAGSETLPIDDAYLLPPIVRPNRNIFCVGTNYQAHLNEFVRAQDADSDAPPTVRNESPEFPIIFTKPASAVIASGESIELHENTTSALDYEAELAVIIGRGGRNIAYRDALKHVWGFTLIND